MIINSGKLSTDVIKRLDKKMVGEKNIYKDSKNFSTDYLLQREKEFLYNEKIWVAITVRK